MPTLVHFNSKKIGCHGGADNHRLSKNTAWHPALSLSTENIERQARVSVLRCLWGAGDGRHDHGR
jgi:hypothetical protein